MRLLDITYIVLKYDLESFLTSYKINKFINFGSKFKRLFFKKLDAPLEKRLRLALEELGPVFVKLGQILSTRADLLPIRFTNELSNLHNNVTPEYINIDGILQNTKEQFLEINYTPIASASIAQVYEATLVNKEKVVLKVIRPNAEKIIKQDLDFFKSLLKILENINPYRSNVVHGIISELETSLLQEIDFEKEIDNAELFRKNMQDFPNVIVPKIYKELSNKKIIVMEKMYGTPIDQIEVLKSKKFNLSAMSEDGLEILMIQILRNRFFHADLHPGNIWIDDNGNRIFLDFGIMGTLTKSDRDVLADMIASLYVRNYERFVELQIQSGWIEKELNKAIYINEIQKIFQFKNLSKSLNEIFNLGEKFGVKVPVQFLLLVKTLLVTEASAKKLNVNLDVGSTGASVILKHFKEHIKYSREK